MTIAAVRFSTIASAKTTVRIVSLLARGATWLNSPPLTEAELQGKVVWSSSGPIPASTGGANFLMCAHGLRSIRTMAWLSIGVHSPEFSFEKNIDNIRWAAKDMRVDYPIAVDNDHAIWRGFLTSIGRRFTLPMRKEEFGITNLEKANTSESEKSNSEIAGRGWAWRHPQRTGLA